MWSYFHKLFNENHIGESNLETISPINDRNYRYIWKNR